MSYLQDAEDIRAYLNSRHPHACRSLVERHQRAVLRVCLNVVKDYQKAEEIAQDVFLKAFSRLRDLKEPEKFRAWIVKMAYYRAIDYWRLKKPPNLPWDSGPHPGDPDPGPEAKVVGQERSSQLVEAIRDLGEPDSSIFILFYLEEMKISEIAEILGLTTSNIKIRLLRGRKELKKKLNRLFNQI